MLEQRVSSYALLCFMNYAMILGAGQQPRVLETERGESEVVNPRLNSRLIWYAGSQQRVNLFEHLLSRIMPKIEQFYKIVRSK